MTEQWLRVIVNDQLLVDTFSGWLSQSDFIPIHACWMGEVWQGGKSQPQSDTTTKLDKHSLLLCLLLKLVHLISIYIISNHHGSSFAAWWVKSRRPLVNGCSGERTLINRIPFLESPLIIGHFSAVAIFSAGYTGNDPCHLGMTMLATAAVAAAFGCCCWCRWCSWWCCGCKCELINKTVNNKNVSDPN